MHAALIVGIFYQQAFYGYIKPGHVLLLCTTKFSNKNKRPYSINRSIDS